MVRKKISRKTPGIYRISLWVLLVAIVAAVIVFVKLYDTVFRPAVNVSDADSYILLIPTGADIDYVVNELAEQDVLKNPDQFMWLAEKKNYPSGIKPGRYRIEDNMSNNELINMLRSGRQEPLNLMFNNVRTLNELAEIISVQLEPDSGDFAEHFTDDSVSAKYGFTKEEFPAMFIPNTYEFYWTTGPEEFTDRMKREYVAFWSGNRSEKAEGIGLTPKEVSILASVVDQESLHDDENATIAGVFMNRLEKGIPLQSDPTIIFALNNFDIRRVLNVHKKIDSPYNTYKIRGLPPGPISIPSVAAIDAVLNYDNHNYLYFVAKPDFSGYHNFARTLSQHNKYARLYRNALDRRKIFK